MFVAHKFDALFPLFVIREQIDNITMEVKTDFFKGIEGHVLFLVLDTVQRGVGDAQFPGESVL